MAERTYISTTSRRTPRPRSKRLRECGGGSYVSGVSVTYVSGGTSSAGADGFSPTITAAVEGTRVSFTVTNRTGSDTYTIDFGDAVSAAVTNANEAATAANTAAASASTAAQSADSAATNATAAASSATSAAQTANDAATNATAAAQSANEAASTASAAAQSASGAASSANSAAQSASGAVEQALAAAASANSAATNASAAAQAAYEAIEKLGDLSGITPISNEEIDELLKNFNFIDSFTVTAEGEYPLTLDAQNSADGADITGSVDISEIAEDDIRKAFEN